MIVTYWYIYNGNRLAWSPGSNIVIQIVAPMCVTGKGRAHPALAKMELNIAFESLVLWNATAIARIMVSLMAKKPSSLTAQLLDFLNFTCHLICPSLTSTVLFRLLEFLFISPPRWLLITDTRHRGYLGICYSPLPLLIFWQPTIGDYAMIHQVQVCKHPLVQMLQKQLIFAIYSLCGSPTKGAAVR